MSRRSRRGRNDAVPLEGPPRRRRRRGVLRRLVLLTLALVLVAGVLAAFAWWSVFVSPDHDIEPGRPVQIEIVSGSDTGEIASQLSEAGVIRNANRFRLEAGSSGLDAELKAGVYDLETGMDYADVIETLAAGPPIRYVTVTIPEGFTIEQMAERFEAETWLSGEEFETVASTRAGDFTYGFLYTNPTISLEGYLFPKTYRIPEDATVEDVIGMMLDQFERETSGIDLSVPGGRDLTTHDWVTLASMIEREVAVADERALVSSVIYNRLDRGMRLEIDATIEYILPGTRPRLLNSHLRIDSPYNTYMYAGLPPGPIAAPGLPALQAAAAPAETEYLYYVLTSDDGSHTFTRTYAEFLEAKEKSREVVP